MRSMVLLPSGSAAEDSRRERGRKATKAYRQVAREPGVPARRASGEVERRAEDDRSEHPAGEADERVKAHRGAAQLERSRGDKTSGQRAPFRQDEHRIDGEQANSARPAPASAQSEQHAHGARSPPGDEDPSFTADAKRHFVAD